MSYVDAYWDREHDCVRVAERVQSQRCLSSWPCRWEFYYDDPAGKYETIFRTPVSRVRCSSRREFQRELKLHSHQRCWESDVGVVAKCLTEHYRHKPAPDLHVAYLDIETGFDLNKGFGTPDDPFNPVTAITVYLNWCERLITLVLCPGSLDVATAEQLLADQPDCVVFDSEHQLLDSFMQLISDADVLSGWNSEGFDIPYLVNRIALLLGKEHTRRLCLWNQLPRSRRFERYGKEQHTYDLQGRIHLDYLQLYQKYTYEERHSYSLDSIAELELGERKVPYEGTLEQLYQQQFAEFVRYNRQDVMLLARLERKLRFLELVNAIAHDSCVPLAAALGSVAVTDQAVINEAHDLGLVVPDKHHSSAEQDTAAGAFVATPRQGLHSWVGAIDINSLYPSVIRALNMAPETIVGQLRPTHTAQLLAQRQQQGLKPAQAWEGLFGTVEYNQVMQQNAACLITVDWQDGSSSDLSAAEIWQLIWRSGHPWVLSANGTIFSQQHVGVIPGLLARWYAERQQMQAYKSLAQQLTEGISLPARLRTGDAVAAQ